MNKKELLHEKIKLLQQIDLKKKNFKEVFAEAEKVEGLTEDYLKKDPSEEEPKKNSK